MRNPLPWILLAVALTAATWFLLTQRGPHPEPSVQPVAAAAAPERPEPAAPLAAEAAPARRAAATHADGEAEAQEGDEAESETVAAPPEAPARLRGLATESDGTPLRGWRVVVVRTDEAPEDAGPARHATPLGEDGSFVFAELPAGSWDVVLERGGFGRLRTFPMVDEPVVLAPGDDRFLSLVLEPGPLTLTGRIGMERAFSGMGVPVELHDERGHVVSRFLSAIDWEREDLDGALDDDHDRAFVSTEGAFEVTGLRPGRYRLVFPAEGVAPLRGTDADGSPVDYQPQAFELVVDLSSDRDLGRIVVHWADYFRDPRAQRLARLAVDVGSSEVVEEVGPPPPGAPPPPHTGGPPR